MVIVDLSSQFYFRFIRISVVDLGIGRVVGLAISRIVLTKADIAIGYSQLFL